MITPLTAPGLTVVFFGVVVSLGAALVWMMWQLEQSARQPVRVRRDHSRSR